jgi:hypothetical protein
MEYLSFCLFILQINYQNRFQKQHHQRSSTPASVSLNMYLYALTAKYAIRQKIIRKEGNQ